MMNCSEWQSRVGSYVDAELPPLEMEAFRAHLATCADCAATTLALTESKIAVRRAGNRYPAPPELRAKVLNLAKGKSELARNATAREQGKRGELCPAVLATFGTCDGGACAARRWTVCCGKSPAK